MQALAMRLGTIAWIQGEPKSFEEKTKTFTTVVREHALLYQDLPLRIPSCPPHTRQMELLLLLDHDAHPSCCSCCFHHLEYLPVPSLPVESTQSLGIRYFGNLKWAYPLTQYICFE